MVTLGQILGTVVGFPLLIFLVNQFYYSNKYNDDAEQYYEDYMNKSYDIEISMPEENPSIIWRIKMKNFACQRLSLQKWTKITFLTLEQFIFHSIL